MSFRPCTEQERLEILGRIRSAREVMANRQGYISKLELELEQGVWQSDINWANVPLPEPDCYLCVNKGVLAACSLSHEYGVVCSDYRHFSEAK